MSPIVVWVRMSAKLPKKATSDAAISAMLAAFDANMCRMATIISTTIGATIISVM